ncbi:hypothetical protein D3C77_621760 [compost metagenome]
MHDQGVGVAGIDHVLAQGFANLRGAGDIDDHVHLVAHGGQLHEVVGDFHAMLPRNGDAGHGQVQVGHAEDRNERRDQQLPEQRGTCFARANYSNTKTLHGGETLSVKKASLPGSTPGMLDLHQRPRCASRRSGPPP